MKRTTKKLSGSGLELFLRRFYASYSGLDEKLARRLSEDSAKTFASVRVRHIAWRDWRPKQDATAAGSSPSTTASDNVDPAPTGPQTKAETPSTKPTPPKSPPATIPSTPSPSAPIVSDDAPFDPYAIGLVPTYQREGPEGLGAKLAGIPSLDNLRKMARSQQVALPAELRGPDADIEAVRAAIIAAVGKRIANRRAAAG